MNSNRLLCLKCTLLEGYKHQKTKLEWYPTLTLSDRSFVFWWSPSGSVTPLYGEASACLMWTSTGQLTSPNWKHGNVWTASHRLSNLTSVYSLMFPRQVHTTRELPFQISLVFIMTLILFSMQGHFRKTTKVKGNRLLCKMNADSRQGLFAS